MTLFYSYNSHIFEGDVALLHTTEEIIFTDNISPICIPSEENSPVAGDVCINSGWGSLGNFDVLYKIFFIYLGFIFI